MFVVMPKHMLNKIMNLKFAVNFRVAAYVYQNFNREKVNKSRSLYKYFNFT